MRVLMFAPGHSIHTQRPIDMLLAEGHEVVLVDANKPHLDNYPRFQYRPYPRPRGKRFSRVFGKRFEAWMNDLTIIFQLRRLYFMLQPDVVHIHWVNPFRADQCLRAGLRPMILSVWGGDILNYFLPGANEDEAALLGSVYARSDLVIVDAPDLFQKVEHLAEQKVNTVSLSLGVDLERFQSGNEESALRWRKNLKIGEQDLVFLSIRAWSRPYQHDLIVDAFAKALSDLPENSRLILKLYNMADATDAGLYADEIRTQIQDLGIQEHVIWVENIGHDELPVLYALADVIVNFPFHDAFPVSFLEAAVSERAVVTTRLPTYEHLLSEDVFFVTKHNDRNGLATKMLEVADSFVHDKQGLQEKLRHARDVITLEYSQRHYIQRLLELYEEQGGK